MRRALPLLVLGLASCEGPSIAILQDAGGDATIDATTAKDATPDAVQVFPDGRVCRGHDEDHDGFPDDCDDCPNINDPEQDLGAPLGAACRPIAPFDLVRQRALFDPFTAFGLWESFGAASARFTLGSDTDSIVGGTDADQDVRFVADVPRAKDAAMVATTIVTLKQGGGRAGILLRVSGDTKRFYACEVNLSLSTFLATMAPDSGCVGGPCKLETFTLPGGGASAMPIPREIPRTLGVPIGVRASIKANDADGGSGGVLECRVFDPDPKAARTGLFAPDRYVMRVDVDASQWLPSGEVGLYAQGVQAQFASIDVLTSK